MEFSRVHIDAIDWDGFTLSTNDGRVFEELSDGTWVECFRGVCPEGSFRYWGGGCHSGQINLTPMYVLRAGQWVNLVTGAADPTPVKHKYSGVLLEIETA